MLFIDGSEHEFLPFKMVTVETASKGHACRLPKVMDVVLLSAFPRRTPSWEL
jgi:hypothetical protein